MCDVSVFGIPQSIDTPCTTACCRDVEEHEAIERREFAVIEQRKEAVRGVDIKVGDRGHAGENECDGPREQGAPPISSRNPAAPPIVMGDALLNWLTGKFKYFVVPCCNSKSPDITRRTLRSCEV